MITSALALNQEKCLRSEYFYNDCKLCLEECEQNALALNESGIKVCEEQCTSCALCIGLCPTEALSLEEFDANRFTLHFINSYQDRIIEKVDIPSLLILDTYHLLAMALRKRTSIILVSQQQTSQEQDLLRSLIYKSNSLLAQLGVEYSIFLQDISELDLQLIDLNQKETYAFEEHEEYHFNELESKTPLKLTLLKDALKCYCEDLHTPLLEIDNAHTFFNKDIDYHSCTNCQDCVNFCPTHALFNENKKDQIFFNAGNCIGCSICHDICKTSAIRAYNSIDLIVFAFNQKKLLVEFNYENCENCGATFVYKEGTKLCSRCKDFQNITA